MSFLGKKYTFDREENFDGFLKFVGLPEDQIRKLLQFKPTTTLIKEGDKYKTITVDSNGTKETVFESGVPFDETIDGVLTIKTTYTVDGNTVTHVVENPNGTATFKREYGDTELKVTISADKWDGVAYRYYKV
ncbi:fatty acid binding protein [Bombyx mori]|uniref:Fatty acid binding protein n=1 Tax=Bombyx mori TaxID=7091 RepID=Q2F5R6_BOMMO|nr:fatty acid binding protein [Bombyx mori]ABD36301.1 fatty acid binding protein [Bombyx mori]BAE96010.1 fatty acid binding protein 2 [Bombyx mori]